MQGGKVWVMGQQVLLRSTDGVNWFNAVANLRHEGSFAVSSVTQDFGGLRIFARNRNGLRCYGWDEWDLSWKVLFSVPTSSPGVFAAWTDRGLVMVARHNDVPDIVCTASASGDCQKWQSAFPGVAVHMQMAPSGVGLCSVWGINNTAEDLHPIPSAAYFTNDAGMTWQLAGTLETHLVAGATVDDLTSLVGGTEGFLALIDHGGIKNFSKESGGCIEAVDVQGPHQVAVIESEDEPPIQSLLARTGSGQWLRYGVGFDGHVACAKSLGSGNCLVCTRQTIYKCRFK